MLTKEEIFQCRVDFKTFIRIVFKRIHKKEFKFRGHHDEIIDAMTKILTGDITRLIVNIPPRYGKTEIIIVMFTAWSWGNFPDSEYLNAATSASLSEENAGKVRAVMESEVYKEIFPDFKLKKNTLGDMKSTHHGAFYSCGAGGGIIGHGFGSGEDDGLFHGCGFIDDPIEAENINHELQRQKINRWYNQSYKTRANSVKSPVVLVMQRLHEDDLANFLMNGGSGEKWHVVSIPVLDENDNPIWPDKHSKEDLEKMRKADPYYFATQYMQSPAPIGGGIFKDQYWKYYTALPAAFTQKVIFADTALKTKESSDYSVFQCWGKTKEGQIYLIDQIRGKWEAPDLETRAKAFYAKHNQGYNLVSNFKVEDKASGTGLIQALSRQGLPISGIQRDIDKYTRAMSVVGMIEAGNVYLPKESDFLSDYLHEFSSFPNGKHDDQIDPTMDAIEHFLRNNIFTDYEAIL